MRNSLKFSIITATLNRLDLLKRCAQSVLEQDYERVEHVIVDGSSTDGTLEFLMSLSDQHGGRIRWISRKDKGISEAINTGLSIATGDVIGWMGSDDGLLPGALRTVSRYLEDHPEALWVYGSHFIVDENGRKLRTMRTKEFNHPRFIRSAYGNVCGPSVFVRRELARTVGPVREDLRYTMDYEWCLRLANIAKPHRIAEFLAYFGWHDGSITKFHRLAQLDEGMRVSQAYACSDLERKWIAGAYRFYKLRAWARRRLLRTLQFAKS